MKIIEILLWALWKAMQCLWPLLHIDNVYYHTSVLTRKMETTILICHDLIILGKDIMLGNQNRFRSCIGLLLCVSTQSPINWRSSSLLICRERRIRETRTTETKNWGFFFFSYVFFFSYYLYFSSIWSKLCRILIL